MRRVVCAAVLAVLSLDVCAKAVKVSEAFGFDAFDSTRFLQQAFDSDADVVVIDRQPTDWISGPLFLTNSNKTVILGDGVVLRAKRNSFKGRCDSFINIPKGTNLTVRGEGDSAIVMNKADYLNKSIYTHSEWRHVFHILGAKGVTIKDLRLVGSGGDGVELAGSKDVLIENVVCENHHRQGISPCAAENLTVRNCVFNGTSGTSPQCGVDLEPFSQKHLLKNILFENCIFNGNNASGILIHLPNIRESEEPVSITFRNCTAVGNRRYGIIIYGGIRRRCVRGSVRFENCRVAANCSSAVRLVNMMPDSVRVLFKDCDIDARGAAEEQVLLFDNSQEQSDFAGIAFENCTLRRDEKTELCTFRGMTGAGLRDVRGEFLEKTERGDVRLTLDAFVSANVPHPELMREFTPGDFDMTKLVAAGANPPRPLTTPWLWRKATYVQHVPAAGEYPIVFSNYAYRVGEKRPLVQVRDRWGTDLGSFVLDDPRTVYTIKANGENLYRFEMTMRGLNRVKVTSSFAGQGFICQDLQALYGHGGGCAHEAWFCVPAKAKEVKVDISAPEVVDAELLDADGKAVASFPKKCGRDVLSVDRVPTAGDEFWCLRFKHVQENCRYRIGGDAVPIVSMSADVVLKERK